MAAGRAGRACCACISGVVWLCAAAPQALLPTSWPPSLPPPRSLELLTQPGYYTPLYAAVLSLGAPLFTLLSTELYPHHLSTPAFLLAWALAALGMLALLLLAVPPAGAAAGSGAGGQPGGTVAVVVTATAAAAAPGGSPLSPSAGGSSAGPLGWLHGRGSGGVRLWQRLGARRQRRNVALSLVASVQCMLWMSVAADELVALFQVGCGVLAAVFGQVQSRERQVLAAACPSSWILPCTAPLPSHCHLLPPA